MKIEPADVADARRDMDVRWIAGEPHAGEAVLHDVERFHHHRGKGRPAVARDDLPLERALGAEYAAEPREAVARVLDGRNRRSIVQGRAVACNRGAAAKAVG